MELWIGPVIFAALLSGLVSAAGWFVNSWQMRRLEQFRRDEKVHDFQVALRAEIASDLALMSVVDRARHFTEIGERYRSDKDYVVFVPQLAPDLVFRSIINEIHILPGPVITPVVEYARLRQTIELFVMDLRADRFRQLDVSRQLAMYHDYLEMLGRLEILARRAMLTLSNSLNSLGGDQSNQSSAAVPAAMVSAEENGEP